MLKKVIITLYNSTVAELVKAITRSWVQILAKSVIVGTLGKSISTVPSYQRSKKWYSEGSDGIVS